MSRRVSFFAGAAQALGKAARGALKVAGDADRMLQQSMYGAIELARHREALDPSARWQPGEPLKLLFVGYAGTRNTGADVRVEEMIRQFRHLFGDANVDLSICTLDPALTRGYFKTVKQLTLPTFFPPFVYQAVREHHAVVACEGSMFKSKFANALSTFMVGGLGMALAQGKIAVGYGGEAGQMDASLRNLMHKTLDGDAFIIARNHASQGILAEFGVPCEVGTDTAWTFEPHPDAVGQQLLRDAGWDGEQPVIAVCPINPFWWPVKPDLKKGAERFAMGMHRKAHYRSVYFHADGAKVDAQFEGYIDAIATGVARVRRERDAFVVLVGMEQLDREAVELLNSKLGNTCPMFVSDEYDMYTLVSMLRQCTAMISSRYHAIVCSMPGRVASAGITMDERIPNLMADRGQPELALRVDDPDLANQVEATLNRLFDDREAVLQGIDDAIFTALQAMGRMGQLMVDHVRKRLPEFPFRDGLGLDGDPWDHLPSLSTAVQRLVTERRAGVAKASAAPVSAKAKPPSRAKSKSKVKATSKSKSKSKSKAKTSARSGASA